MHGRQQPLAPDVIPSPTPPPTPCSDNQNCFQVLPNIAWGPKCPHSGTTALDYAVSRAGDADWLEHGLKRYGHMPREPSTQLGRQDCCRGRVRKQLRAELAESDGRCYAQVNASTSCP